TRLMPHHPSSRFSRFLVAAPNTAPRTTTHSPSITWLTGRRKSSAATGHPSSWNVRKRGVNWLRAVLGRLSAPTPLATIAHQLLSHQMSRRDQLLQRLCSQKNLHTETCIPSSAPCRRTAPRASRPYRSGQRQ